MVETTVNAEKAEVQEEGVDQTDHAKAVVVTSVVAASNSNQEVAELKREIEALKTTIASLEGKKS